MDEGRVLHSMCNRANTDLFVSGAYFAMHVKITDGVEHYDVREDKWTTLKSMPDRRGLHSSCCLDDHLYIICGLSYENDARGTNMKFT